MPGGESLVEVWRGPILESAHSGHAVIWDAGGGIVRAWGDPAAVILPRSSCKMIQALPLIESGAADAFALGEAQLALACASHTGAAIHTGKVKDWLADLDLGEDDLRCGPQMPDDREARYALIRAHEDPCQIHNNCSGKHAGFLTLARHLRAGPEYVDPDHPVQRAARTAFEEVTGEDSPGFGIDGCSAPNFATSISGLALAMAGFAAADPGGGRRDRARARLWQAMAARPELVAGEGAPCTRLMRAMGGRAVVKTGAEAVNVAIFPERGLGFAVKVDDGATRGALAVITQLLVGTGAIAPDDPVARRHTHGPILNRRGLAVGHLRLVESLRDWRI